MKTIIMKVNFTAQVSLVDFFLSFALRFNGIFFLIS